MTIFIMNGVGEPEVVRGQWMTMKEALQRRGGRILIFLDKSSVLQGSGETISIRRMPRNSLVPETSGFEDMYVEHESSFTIPKDISPNDSNNFVDVEITQDRMQSVPSKNQVSKTISITSDSPKTNRPKGVTRVLHGLNLQRRSPRVMEQARKKRSAGKQRLPEARSGLEYRSIRGTRKNSAVNKKIRNIKTAGGNPAVNNNRKNIKRACVKSAGRRSGELK